MRFVSEVESSVNYRVEEEMNFIKVESLFELVAVDLYGPLPKGLSLIHI